MRPFVLRALMTRRPVAVRMRARKPEVRLRLRLVPPKVRFVMVGISPSSQQRLSKPQLSIVPPL